MVYSFSVSNNGFLNTKCFISVFRRFTMHSVNWIGFCPHWYQINFTAKCWNIFEFQFKSEEICPFLGFMPDLLDHGVGKLNSAFSLPTYLRKSCGCHWRSVADKSKFGGKVGGRVYRQELSLVLIAGGDAILELSNRATVKLISWQESVH